MNMGQIGHVTTLSSMNPICVKVFEGMQCHWGIFLLSTYHFSGVMGSNNHFSGVMVGSNNHFSGVMVGSNNHFSGVMVGSNNHFSGVMVGSNKRL
jgi:hypothetical protein